MHFNCRQKLSLTCPYIYKACNFLHTYFSITPDMINCVKLRVFHIVDNGYDRRYAFPQTRHWILQYQHSDVVQIRTCGTSTVATYQFFSSSSAATSC